MDNDKEPSLLTPLVIAVFLVLAFAVVSSTDYAEALTQDAIRKDPPKDYFPASLVIPYDAYVCQDSGGKKVCKAYVSGTTRKEIR
jgi:hypothetical protein